MLGGLPEDSVHCALLAAETLRRALADYLAHRNEPWKRAFRKTSGRPFELTGPSIQYAKLLTITQAEMTFGTK